jgi:hypothetical protein
MPREKKAAVQQQQQQQQQQRDDPHEIIHLNVGGTKYATSRSTLVSQPGTFLAEMFSGQMGEPRKDMDGSYFIDRDGSSFRHVLNFLRDGTLPSNALSSSESARMRKEMKMEAAFYQIPQLLRWAQGNDTIGGQGTSEADRVVDAYRGACSRVVSAAYGRTAEQLIEEVSDFLIVCAEQGQASATCVLYRHIDGTRDVLVPWPTVTATLDSERSKRVTPQQLPLPGPGLHTAVETVVARLEELGFPCQLHDDGRLLVDIQHTRPTARDTPERATMSDVALLLRDVRCTADSILDSIRKVGRELLES